MLKLRLLTGPRAGRQLRISDTKPVSIGRRKGRLRLYDSRVSKNHAEICFANGVWVLRDLDSANGTYVNRKKVRGLVELESRDMVQMGRVLVKVVRCDGIGMDTQPALPDDGLPDLTPPTIDEMDAELAEVSADDELDLQALLDQPDGAADPDDDSDEFDIDIDIPDSAAPTTDVGEASDADDEALTAGLEGFDDDDDDSFFADFVEPADTPDDAGLSLQDDDDEPDLAEAFADDAPIDTEAQPTDEDATRDLISLDDDSGSGPASAGTTLMSAVDPNDDADDSDDEEDEDADDEKPTLVGLHIQHAPPHQPEPDNDDEPLVLDELDAPADHEDALHADAALDSDALLADAGPPDGNAPLIEPDEIEPIDLVDAPDAPAAENLDESSILETDGAADLDMFDAEDDAEDADTADDETEPAAAAVTEPLTDAPDDAEPAEQTPDEAFAQAIDDEQSADEILAELLDEADDAPIDDPLSLPPGILAEHDAPPPEFDIDAAFDALSEGLDDSQEMPAITDDLASDTDQAQPDEADGPNSEHAPDDADAESIAPLAEHPDEPPGDDPLVGSQLDIGFIKDALAKLDQDEAAQDQPPQSDPPQDEDNAPKASAEPVVAPAPPFMHNPPPGLNPTSLNPPTEPRSSYRPKGKGGSGRWFFMLLLFMGLGGAGGWLISQNYSQTVTGRDTPPLTEDADAPSAEGSNASTTATGTPESATNNSAERDSPDPFGNGPSVIGSDALAGITANSGTSGTTTDATGTPATPDPSDNRNSQANLAPTNNNTAAPPASPAGIETPDPTVADTPAPPARIVFLIDASGSLVDSLPQMLVWLNAALQTIEPDERFAVYFFKSGEPIAIKPQGMLRPSRDLLAQINEDWLSPNNALVFPSGRSNPTQAITQALSLNPTDLYFLSDDAFAFHSGGTTAEQALQLVKETVGENGVRIHGVQFFYRNDASVLEALANQYNGTFEFIRERVVPEDEGIDLLEEFGGE